MRLLQLRPDGFNRQSTPKDFVALFVRHPPQKRRKFGLIGDRPSIRSTIIVNGKNFISVNAMRSGGPGAAIAHLLMLEIPTDPKRQRMTLTSFETAGSTRCLFCIHAWTNG
jgi:hypothetical protein